MVEKSTSRFISNGIEWFLWYVKSRKNRIRPSLNKINSRHKIYRIKSLISPSVGYIGDVIRNLCHRFSCPITYDNLCFFQIKMNDNSKNLEITAVKSLNSQFFRIFSAWFYRDFPENLAWNIAISPCKSESECIMKSSYSTSCWNPRDNQSWTALFQIFDVFQRWFRENEEHQRWSTLFQSWSTLILSESALFRAEKFSAVSEKISSESALFRAAFLNSET